MKSSKAHYKYAIRRTRKSAEHAQNNAFLNRIINAESGDIFQEIKKFRGHQRVLSSRIDEQVGSKQIADHFASKYQKLYSKSQLGTKFDLVNDKVQSNISDEDFKEISKIDQNLIKEALGKMKGGKGDVNFSFSSDCLTNGPKIMLNHLASLFRVFLVHGRVADILLMCSLVPIVKNNLADITSSDNYRAIAKSSLILKLFDWVVLLREG